MTTVRRLETFVSLQGESTYSGLPCFFVRLAGCNLHCRYCDTPNVHSAGMETPIERVVAEFQASGVPLAEITGGEPLLQEGFPALATALREVGRGPVLVETNGSQNLARVPEGVIAIMDLKCPGSGESAAMDFANVGRLRPYDEVKFVITDRADFDWAAEQVRRHRLAERCHAVLFSPARGGLDPAVLARWLLAERLPVRLQIQLHVWLNLK